MKKTGLIFVTTMSLLFTACGNNVPKHVHNWGNPTYVWSSDYSSCTASRVCLDDETHVESETASSSYSIVTPAQCETDGLGRYTVSFENAAFTSQSYDESIEHLNHDYQFDSFVWTEYTAQAKYVCSHNSSHVIFYDAEVTSVISTPASCENTGIRTYTATYGEHSDTKLETLPKLGHDYQFDSFVWNGYTAQAKYVCSRYANHVKYYDANVTSEVTTPATCEGTGIRTYTATFSGYSDTKTEVLSALGHNYVFDSFVWDGFTAQAKYVCSRDANHIEYHNAEVTSEITDEPDCTNTGIRTYTALYDGHSETKDEVLSALGHDWGEVEYELIDDDQMTATRVCNNDSDHVEEETVTGEYQVITPATEDSDGLGRYTFTFTNPAFETQTKDVVIYKPYFGSKPVLSDDEKTITFGLYPQTNVDDEDLIEELNELTDREPNGWYRYNGEYYAYKSANPYSEDYEFENGTAIKKYKGYWYKCEPIVWNVLSNNNGEYYILSSVLLDVQQYHYSTADRTIDGVKIYANNYEHSEIRCWLNETFYENAFILGKDYIQTTEVDNSAASTGSTTNQYACNDTEDKVFLPSYSDYNNTSYGFANTMGSTATRRCKTTDYARSLGAICSLKSGTLYNAYYWTRSPTSGYKSQVIYYDSDGCEQFNEGVNRTYRCVRPAMTIKLVLDNN